MVLLRYLRGFLVLALTSGRVLLKAVLRRLLAAALALATRQVTPPGVKGSYVSPDFGRGRLSGSEKDDPFASELALHARLRRG